MLYTSYFARAKQADGPIEAVSISRYRPKWFDGKEIKEFSPSVSLLDDYKSGLLTKEDYTARYQKEVLDGLTFAKAKRCLSIFWTDDFKDIWESETNHALLCCYEKEGEFCHRHLLSEYLTSIGIRCREVDKLELESLLVEERARCR